MKLVLIVILASLAVCLADPGNLYGHGLNSGVHRGQNSFHSPGLLGGISGLNKGTINFPSQGKPKGVAQGFGGQRVFGVHTKPVAHGGVGVHGKPGIQDGFKVHGKPNFQGGVGIHSKPSIHGVHGKPSFPGEVGIHGKPSVHGKPALQGGFVSHARPGVPGGFGVHGSFNKPLHSSHGVGSLHSTSGIHKKPGHFG